LHGVRVSGGSGIFAPAEVQRAPGEKYRDHPIPLHPPALLQWTRMLAPVLSTACAHPPSASVVVITDVDGVLRHSDTRSLAEARPGLDALASDRWPVVLCSEQSAAELIRLQRELGLRHPFICENGAALYIPGGYFCECVDLGRTGGEWEVIEFGRHRGVTSPVYAVRLLIALYRACGNPFIIGIGSSWRDGALLREVDTAIVVRSEGADQTRLLRKVPTAYLTTACGPAGWTEAILGHCSVARA
jgi:predicted mannosyl-3-phosphoglycerate phosphatase (HAD superfamily)